MVHQRVKNMGRSLGAVMSMIVGIILWISVTGGFCYSGYYVGGEWKHSEAGPEKWVLGMGSLMLWGIGLGNVSAMCGILYTSIRDKVRKDKFDKMPFDNYGK